MPLDYTTASDDRPYPVTKDNKKQVSPSITLFIVSAVQFLTPFLASAMGVALPSIGHEFEAGAVQLSMIQLIYILAVSALMLPMGRFGDIYGRKKIFNIGIMLITLATFLITLAQNIEVFILFRFLQGIGAAMITATGVAILTSVFPKSERGRAMGIIIAFVYVGLAAGPTIAGFLITHFGWRWFFWAVIPLEMVALFLAFFKLHGEWFGAKGEPFDWKGTFVYMTALCCLMFGGSLLGKLEGAVFIAGAGTLGMAAFLYLESRTPYPLLQVNLLTSNLRFSFSNLVTLINYGATYGLIFLFSLFLQEVQGYSAQQAGLVLIIQSIVQAFIAPTAGKLADRYPPPVIATFGQIICTTSLLLSIFIDANSSLIYISTIFILMGTGFGFFSSPNMVTIMGSVEQKFYGVAASVVATMRSLGMLFSMALITVVLANLFGDEPISTANRMGYVQAMRISLIIFTSVGTVGILLSWMTTKRTTH